MYMFIYFAYFDNSYSNLVNYKPPGGVQGYYNPSKADVGNKMQHQTGGMTGAGHNPQTQQQQQQQSGSYQFPYYPTQSMVTAAAAQGQQVNQSNQSAGGNAGQGPNGMVPMHGRPAH